MYGVEGALNVRKIQLKDGHDLLGVQKAKQRHANAMVLLKLGSVSAGNAWPGDELLHSKG